MIRRRPDTGLRAWQLAFGRPPTPPPQKVEAAALGKGLAARECIDIRDSTPLAGERNADITLMLARCMPKTCAALLTGGGSIRQLAEALPATAAALSGVLLK